MRPSHFAYASRLESIARARDDVTEFARDCGFVGSDLHDIRAAASEACANAVEHGHVMRAMFSVDCFYSRGTLSIRVTDTGGGAPGKLLEPPIPRKQHGGFGLTIMRALMDDVTLDIQEGGGSTLTMSKRAASAAADEAAP
ncbi:MAG TPA: ATP-binding protein [Candidatus Binatus sp.]|nr:ATP-binding protein [Candidatus Binatus sp.]